MVGEFLKATYIQDLPKQVKDQTDCMICCVSTLADETRDATEESAGAERAVLLPCGHVFGEVCIRTWLSENKNCPMCRSDMSARVESLKMDLDLVELDALRNKAQKFLQTSIYQVIVPDREVLWFVSTLDKWHVVTRQMCEEAKKNGQYQNDKFYWDWLAMRSAELGRLAHDIMYERGRLNPDSPSGLVGRDVKYASHFQGSILDTDELALHAPPQNLMRVNSARIEDQLWGAYITYFDADHDLGELPSRKKSFITHPLARQALHVVIDTCKALDGEILQPDEIRQEIASAWAWDLERDPTQLHLKWYASSQELASADALARDFADYALFDCEVVGMALD